MRGFAHQDNEPKKQNQDMYNFVHNSRMPVIQRSKDVEKAVMHINTAMTTSQSLVCASMFCRALLELESLAALVAFKQT